MAIYKDQNLDQLFQSLSYGLRFAGRSYDSVFGQEITDTELLMVRELPTVQVIRERKISATSCQVRSVKEGLRGMLSTTTTSSNSCYREEKGQTNQLSRALVSSQLPQL